MTKSKKPAEQRFVVEVVIDAERAATARDSWQKREIRGMIQMVMDRHVVRGTITKARVRKVDLD